MRVNPLVSSFYIQKFAGDVSTPFTSFNAYKEGLIDQDGNFTGLESSIDSYEYLIIKLKKIFQELPGGLTKSNLNSYYTTLQMFTEECSWYGIDKEQMTFFIEGYISAQTDGNVSYIELLEDMGVGGGAGAIGTPASAPGANQGNVSGFDPVMGDMQKRKEQVPSFIDQCEMFDVCPEEYDSFKLAKAWRNVPPSPTKNYLQRYQRRNPTGKLAVKNSESGDIHWINYS
jgi:hypothetical protein